MVSNAIYKVGNSGLDVKHLPLFAVARFKSSLRSVCAVVSIVAALAHGFEVLVSAIRLVVVEVGDC